MTRRRSETFTCSQKRAIMEKIWKDIPGWEGRYQASTLGEIKSMPNRKHKEDYNLKPVINSVGYYQVYLYDNGKKKCYKVHRLVYEAFNGPIPEGMQVNHINEVKTDNRLTNLNLMTCEENNNWGTRNERIAAKNGRWVIKLSLNNEILHFYKSANEAGREVGIDIPGVIKCCNGKLKTSGGFIWKYAE